MGRNFVPVSMAAPLQYLLITVKVVALQTLSFSDTENPKTVKPLTADEKHYLLNIENFAQRI